MNGLLIGQDNVVAEWAFRSFRFIPSKFDQAIGVVTPAGELVGAVLFQGYNGHDVHLSLYGSAVMTAGIIRSIARVLVITFRASRVTAVVNKRNRSLQRSMTRLGWRIEGMQRRYYGPDDRARYTGVRFVMFRERIEEIAGVKVAPLILRTDNYVASPTAGL